MIKLQDILFVLLCLFGGLYFYYKRKYSYWKNRGVPFRKPIMPFGNLWKMIFFRESVANYFAELYNEFEDPYIGFYSFTRPYLLIKDRHIIKQLLIKDYNVFPNRSFFSDKNIDPVMCNSLLGVKGSQWKVLRRKISPVFTSGKLKLMFPLMIECSKCLKTYLNKQLNENVEMKAACVKYTTDVIASCAFGINANSFNAGSHFLHYGRTIFPLSKFRTLQSMSYIFAPIFIKIFKYSFMNKSSTKYFRSVFMETFNERQTTDVKRNDLVDILNEIRNEENDNDIFKFDEDIIFAQAIIFLGAALDTSSSTIAFTLHELSINIAIQDKLRKEIHSVIEKHGGVTYEAVQNMTYLDMVISETLRKYPLTPLLTRECAANYKLPTTGLVIEKGTIVVMSQKGLHWDPRYFPNPEIYDPERFNAENKHNIPSCVYVPFGDGPKNCIGERFGILSTKLGVISVLQNNIVERNTKTKEPMEFAPLPLLHSKYGVNLTIRKYSA